VTALNVIDTVEGLAGLAGLAAALLAGRRLAPEMRWTFAGFMLLSAYHGLSNVLEWTGITSALDVWEDYFDVVRPVLLGGIFFLLARETSDRELRAATAELERQNHELRKLDRIKDALIRDVTHELKTPVAKQAMQLEILKTEIARLGGTPRVERSLDVLEGGIRRQEAVIRNILELAYLESGRRERRLAPTRIDLLLGEVVADYREALEACGATATVEALPCTISSDGEMLWHVFSNLVNNAIKYRRPGVPARIRVALTHLPGGVEVRVADNGIGLTAAERERAFERFFQGNAANEGCGVGLAICRLVLGHLDGDIRLESPGRDAGTTAVVSLPGCAPDPAR
jgi:signal transduction histidine kinase